MIHRPALIFLLTALAAPALLGQVPATLNVEVNRPKAAVSPTLYGLLTEEINYSYDGGLYAELVRNRTFRFDWSGILNYGCIVAVSDSGREVFRDRSCPAFTPYSSRMR